MTLVGSIRTVYDNEAMVQDAASGLTISEIAEEMGVSYAAARIALNRRGLTTVREAEKTVRQRAEEMKPLDAVDYLLGILEQIELINPTQKHFVDGLGVKFTAIQRRIMVALHDSKGVLSREAIYAAMYFDRADADDLPDLKIIDVQISRIRKKLPMGVNILTSWGVGYSLEVSQ